MRCSPALLLSLAACHGGGDAGITLSLEPRPDNALIADATVSLTEPGAVSLSLWSEAVSPMRTSSTAVAADEVIPVLGLRGRSTYYIQAIAELADGTVLESDVQTFESGELPAGIPSLVVNRDASPAEITVIGPSIMEEPAEPSEGEAPAAPEEEFYLLGVDGEGEVVWYYASDDLAQADTRNRFMKPLPDGNLLVQMARGFRIITPDGRLLREVTNQNLGVEQLHHDAAMLPGGNLVLMGMESRLLEVAAFDEPVTVEGDVLVEIDAEGSVVWRWSAFDHLDTDRWPGELAQTLSSRAEGEFGEWTHGNAVYYDEASDSLVLSLRHQNWVIDISHATGEVLWKLGEDGDFALQSGEWFTSQHAATMPSADEVLLYDNGNEKDSPYSRAVAYRIDTAARTASQIWEWEPGMFTSNQGDVDRLANGNTFVCAGGERDPSEDARIAEVDPAGEVVWELDVREAWIYRAARVEWLSPGG